jgi:hypothetical protein
VTLAGKILVLIGVLVVVAGAAQLAAVTAFSTDPNPNPVGNGMLFTASLFAGAILVSVGLVMVGGKKVRKWV